ncbi:hypothetical protein [Pseudooceanicola sp. 200-1SW]|uniref:hypothetical protein n=1 Tax=Pseudooceanicola sp. 200-1SW TaxID=3425949 RepID=UPI003D7F2DB0
MKRLILALAALGALAGCGAKNADYDQPDPARAERAYHHDAPPSLTLITIRSNDSGKGAHTALLINGSERVIFDPAGSFHHPQIRRDGDVLVGISPAFWEGYRSMHARETHHVDTQTVTVSAAVAEQALRLAYGRGAVPGAQCANSTSAILAQLPGFEGIRRTWWPNQLEESFQQVTGVAPTSYYEDYSPVPAGAVLGIDRTTVARAEG